ncbi:MAG: c-type cytochrome [Betaproteobacteria bacterium]
MLRIRSFASRLAGAVPLMSAVAAALALAAAPQLCAAQQPTPTPVPQVSSPAAAVSPPQRPWSGIGRPATRSEIAAWDIDVRPDLKGLPAGKGSVDEGLEIWEAKCASCHGTFGESNEVFTPVVGGTTKDDIRTGRVANLKRTDYPQRTTMMKLSQISTLWDYINRAMPWNEPKSLKADEVYAVVAYILNLAEVVPNDFVLSDSNIAQVQQRLPNRNGKVTHDGLWSVSGRPDVQGDACVSDCKLAMDVRSILPDFARNAHGNLAEQNRPVGPVRGADTSQPALREPLSAASAAKATQVSVVTAASRGPAALARESNCLACHATASRMVGPSFKEVAERYRGDGKAEAALSARIKNGAQGVWGAIPMPPHPNMADDDIRSLVRWILAGAS